MIGISADRFALDGAWTPDAIDGTPGDDRIDGTDGADSINGLGGDDLVQGLGGNDLILGGAGDDTLLGGSGRDTLDGGGGNNVLSGGSGNDLFIVRDLETTQVDGGSGFDTADLSKIDAPLSLYLYDQFDQTNLMNIEGVIGTRFADTIRGDQQHNVFYGKGGDDNLIGDDLHVSGEQGDKLVGGAGDDNLSGSDGADTLKGGSGDDGLSGDWTPAAGNADLIDGGSGDDRLIVGGGDSALGGAGDDRFYLATGDNSLTGGAGADTFFFDAFGLGAASIGTNLITDLAAEDLINLQPIDADTTHSGDQAFTLVSSLDGHAGEAALVYDSGADETALELDTDGDGTADITIRLSGDQNGFTNFVL